MQEQKDNKHPECSYFYSEYLLSGILVNCGYNCNHPKQKEVIESNGKKVGCCYCWSCPL